MTINLSVNVKCPYCGISNNVILNIDKHYIPKQIVACEIGMGGCGKDFVIDPHFEIIASVYRIEEKTACQYCFKK